MSEHLTLEHREEDNKLIMWTDYSESYLTWFPLYFEIYENDILVKKCYQLTGFQKIEEGKYIVPYTPTSTASFRIDCYIDDSRNGYQLITTSDTIYVTLNTILLKNNKIVKSIRKNRKEVKKIIYNLNGKIVWEKENMEIDENALYLTFNGTNFISNGAGNANYGITGSNMNIDWGDGTIESIQNNKRFSHTYDASGEYQIKITGDITALPSNVFNRCSGLTSVIIPNKNIIIKNSVFYNCSDLTDIIIPNSIISMGYGVFVNCSKLINITLPNSITSIGENFFAGCSNLTSVVIPSSITSIGLNAFSLCTKLIDYQLYWDIPPNTFNKLYLINNTDTYFTIPNGTTANYVAKSFPSSKLIERS